MLSIAFTRKFLPAPPFITLYIQKLTVRSEMLVANYFPKMMAKATAYAAQIPVRRDRDIRKPAQERSLLD
jgi:hypothetical protein